jgi:protein-L-isoaspartate(D-aspartate) O-methyltransferase
MASLAEQKESLIRMLIDEGVLKTPAIIEAFRKVPREAFMPEQWRRYAYHNEPFPIGHGQTISQPQTVAAMTEALQPEPGHKILEIGAGSGYQAAILAEIVGMEGKVITIERTPQLVALASKNLSSAGYPNAVVIRGDGTKGHEAEAPYDRIIVTASAPKIPEALVKQLKVGGQMVIPVEESLLLLEKTGKDKVETTSLGFYAFVPLIGEHGHKE